MMEWPKLQLDIQMLPLYHLSTLLRHWVVTKEGISHMSSCLDGICLNLFNVELEATSQAMELKEEDTLKVKRRTFLQLQRPKFNSTIIEEVKDAQKGFVLTTLPGQQLGLCTFSECGRQNETGDILSTNALKFC